MSSLNFSTLAAILCSLSISFFWPSYYSFHSLCTWSASSSSSASSGSI
jgi:hypothetical protein